MAEQAGIKSLIEGVKDTLDERLRTWEEFKQKNDERIALVEKNLGQAEVKEQLDKMSGHIDKLEEAMKRPVAASRKEVNEESSLELKKLLNKFSKSRAGSQTILSDFFESNKAEFKSLSVNSEPNGGYLVMPEYGGIVMGRVFETSPIRQLASVTTISTDAIELVSDDDEAAAAWTSEEATINETATPTVNRINIPTHELSAEPRATNKILEDAATDMEAWLTGKLVDIFSRTENTAFISGNGVTRPRGITTYSNWAAAGTYEYGKVEQINSGGATTITANGLINLVYALKDEYQANATMCFSRGTGAAIRQLTQPGAGASGYLWQPSFQAGEPDTVLGAPVSQWNDLVSPAGTTYTGNDLPIVFGDIRRAYQIVDRIGFTLLRDPYTAKPFVKFYARKRVGGAVVNFDAVKIQKISS